ncbi:ABC transporter ATP-binding protein [Jiangella anatolica]|uniref:Peptide ABC transporter ATP-binding protein n=1 Tax=Jiangella anatolica TaxID=2670374 RepID=A0A2W2C1D3_9ACTN|nr:oligopeptide/dipeptide ABC transporter ATP-binding protein [Jiangella anatolica]PZF85868.1 peptide ABC transporter ATP-binding protein [Jiangella anatolica]
MTATLTDEIVGVEDLRKFFPVRGGVLRRQVAAIRALDGVSFSLRVGETLGLVGESGCGKSTVGQILVGLTTPTSGTVRFRGVDVETMPAADRRELRCAIQIVFQDPYSSLSPRMTARELVSEPLRVQGGYRSGGRDRVVELLEMVGLSAEHLNRYAHEFSGGQRQRLGIARALALDPSVLVLDEPVSALDVSIRAQVVNQLATLQRELGLAYLFISHDLSVVRHSCDRVIVMYLGKVVESGDKLDIFERPAHPYTRALLSAIPLPDPALRDRPDRIVLSGDVPSPRNPPSGCRFRTRCWKAQDVCATTEPVLTPTQSGTQSVACHFPEQQ